MLDTIEDLVNSLSVSLWLSTSVVESSSTKDDSSFKYHIEADALDQRGADGVNKAARIWATMRELDLTIPNDLIIINPRPGKCTLCFKDEDLMIKFKLLVGSLE